MRIIISAILVTLFTQVAVAQTTKVRAQNILTLNSTGGGNGGDFIRMKFISIGENILKDRKDQISKVLKNHRIEELKENLTIDVISVTNIKPKDNKKNPVDALGEYKRIVLFEGDPVKNTGWYGIFNKQKDMSEMLVLHEMLRSIGVNDDSYVHSSEILKIYDLFIDSNGQPKVAWSQEVKKNLGILNQKASYADSFKTSAMLMEKELASILSRLPESTLAYIESYRLAFDLLTTAEFKDRTKHFSYKHIIQIMIKTLTLIEEEIISKQGLIDYPSLHSKILKEEISNLRKISLNSSDKNEEIFLLNASLKQALRLIDTKKALAPLQEKIETCLELEEVLSKRSCTLDLKLP